MHAVAGNDAASPEALRAAIERGRSLFAQCAVWGRMIPRAMTRDFSWAAAARRYLALYRGLHPAPAA
jgi:starch synthase